VTQDELDAIRKRADAATPGPWTTPEKNPTDEYYASCFPADEDFIGHAREDIPALLDEIERLRAAATSVVEAYDFWDADQYERDGPGREIEELREVLGGKRQAALDAAGGQE
jgi:hypothetical protein